MERDDKILSSIKKLIGPAEDYDYFDPDLAFHINAALSILRQLGIGPQEGFRIETGEETWTEFLGDRKDLEMVKDYVYAKVKLSFDPPTSGTLLAALQESIKEFEWRSYAEMEISHL